MEKRIIRTSAQAKQEQTNAEAMNSCPECGKVLPVHIEKRKSIKTGWFRFKLKVVREYTCCLCGCKWEVDMN